jgi:hypothetical protein
MRENGRNCLRLNYFKCYLGGKNPGWAVLDII